MSFQVNIPPSQAAKMAKNEEDKEVTADAKDDQIPIANASSLANTSNTTESKITEELTTGKKREDWRKIKELEEARKAGTAPAMQDEEGKDINPHIPQYIMQAPWYIGSLQPTLKHQREPDEWKKTYNQMQDWYKRGVKEDSIATKFRKGACQNCGAVTHQKKDCVERPRKVGAKYTGTDIAPDEYLQPKLDFDYEGKRDRWNGYDPSLHKKIYEQFQKMEEVKNEMKANRLEKSILEGEAKINLEKDEEVKEGEDDDDDKYADDMAMPGQKFETKQRITVRNLRIREDTAKYLYNLEAESAFYDPKTRSMRENPFRESGVDPRELPYAGDNFVRWSGDAYEIAKKQLFAWEAYEKGSEVHVQADPTKLEILDKEYRKKKDAYKDDLKSNIIEKYGGQEHLNVPPKQLLLAQTEDYVEYSRHGTLLKGNEKPVIKSSYEEDIFEKNHTTVWGSFWVDGKWGYRCCQSLIRGSYCIGKAGLQEQLIEIENTRKEEEEIQEKLTEKLRNEILEKLENNEISTSIITDNSNNQPKSLLQQHLEKQMAEEKLKKKEEKNLKKRKRKKDRKRKKHKSENSNKKKKYKKISENQSESGSDSSNEEDGSEKKIIKAIKKEKERLTEVDKLMKLEEKKRPYNVMYDGKGPTEEDIEAYKRLRMREDDPMSKFLNI